VKEVGITVQSVPLDMPVLRRLTLRQSAEQAPSQRKVQQRVAPAQPAIIVLKERRRLPCVVVEHLQ